MDTNFLPTTLEEVKYRHWERLDVILVSGDSYIDSPYIGVAVIGRQLEKAGYRVGIIAQPEINSPEDITRLGEPTLFWGVTGGSVDLLVANYTASRKKRRSDDYTPGGLNNRRPDRAVIVYSNLIRRYFKNTVPIVLGGIEASLRRVAHYDFWSDSIRRSILFDAKADYLLYGMADQSILSLAAALKQPEDITSVRGLCYMRKPPRRVISSYRLMKTLFRTVWHLSECSILSIRIVNLRMLKVYISAMRTVSWCRTLQPSILLKLSWMRSMIYPSNASNIPITNAREQ